MEWISVEDATPGVEEPVLVTDGEGVNIALLCNVASQSCRIKLEWWSCSDFEPLNCELPITHWMPLPSPPEQP